MFQDLEVFRTAMALARHSGHSQALSARNMANSDTPDYHSKYLEDFTEVLRSEGGSMRATRPEHLHGDNDLAAAERIERDAPQDPNGNTVSLEREMLRAVDAQRKHQRALTIYRSNLSVLRASLGR